MGVIKVLILGNDGKEMGVLFTLFNHITVSRLDVRPSALLCIWRAAGCLSLLCLSYHWHQKGHWIIKVYITKERE